MTNPAHKHYLWPSGYWIWPDRPAPAIQWLRSVWYHATEERDAASRLREAELDRDPARWADYGHPLPPGREEYDPLSHEDI